MIVFITGGAKNGKSGLAQKLAVQLSGNAPRYYAATMIPVDGEDRLRVRRHVADREGLGFITVECGRNIDTFSELKDPLGTVLLDSVTALLMNEMFVPPDWNIDMAAGERCICALKNLEKTSSNLVIVSDYIYSDAEFYDSVTQVYRSKLADIDRFLAETADVVLEVSAGCCIVHKGEGLL